MGGVSIFALRGCRQAEDILRLYLLHDLLKGECRQMVAFIDNDVPVFCDEVFDSSLPWVLWMMAISTVPLRSLFPPPSWPIDLVQNPSLLAGHDPILRWPADALDLADPCVNCRAWKIRALRWTPLAAFRHPPRKGSIRKRRPARGRMPKRFVQRGL